MGRGSAYGKIILLGEHAVVHGRPALGAALSEGVSAFAMRSGRADSQLSVPSWGLQVRAEGARQSDRAFGALLQALNVRNERIDIVGEPQIPAGAGLGASAALAVAVARAVADLCASSLTPAEASAAAFASETLLHGRASGLDNELAARGGVLLFQRDQPLRAVRASTTFRFIIGDSGSKGATLETVQKVAALHRGRRAEVEQRFDEIAGLVEAGTGALVRGERAELGELMTENHAILRWLDVSNFTLDKMVDAALEAGALGAKLTGGGGGGSVIALVDGEGTSVAEAWGAAGHTCLTTEIRGSGLNILPS